MSCSRTTGEAQTRGPLVSSQHSTTALPQLGMVFPHTCCLDNVVWCAFEHKRQTIKADNIVKAKIVAGLV